MINSLLDLVFPWAIEKKSKKVLNITTLTFVHSIYTCMYC